MRSPASDIIDKLPARAEQTFFDDPAIDRAMGVVMALATEVYVLRDRQRALERQLTAAGILNPMDLDAEPPAAEKAANAADLNAFVAHLMSSVLGVQASKGAE